VQEVKVIEGNPLLNSAATDAVKQWKYRPLTVHGTLVLSSPWCKSGFVSKNF
jgi:hypothetical protein